MLGFSFWFFMVVPFASHRESYSWLAGVQTESLAHQFSFGLSSTYRPLSQIVTRLGFAILDVRVFPTNALRQALLQGFIYGMFVLAWWLIYSGARQRRLFALVACVAGGVFFSGYVHLFHIYGLFYLPVILMVGALLRFHAADSFDIPEVWFAVLAIVLAFWHPFATALFIGFYFGFYLDTFLQRRKGQHVQALMILLVGLMAIMALVALFPRAQMPTGSRLFGFLVTYQTNEVNRVASFVAFLLAQMVVFSMVRSTRLKLAAFSFVTAALFAIVVAVYVTSLGWLQAENALSFFKPQYALGIILASTIILLAVRAGIAVPVVTRVATPLLTERERTYQLEDALAWLHNSPYCGYDVAFAENSGSPVDSVESAITRRNRPPAGLQDVQLYWNTVLRCHSGERANDKAGTAVVTFGGPALADFTSAFAVKGKYAGDATIWIPNTREK